MPTQGPRRLGTPRALSLYERIASESLACAYSEPELDELVARHPELIIEAAGNVLGALSHGDAIVLPYAFVDHRAFSDHFEAMFKRLLPKARKAYDADTVRFRLSHGPARPVVEPVLRRLSFKHAHSWLQFSLEKGTRLPPAPLPRGVTIAAPGAGDVDVEALLAVDREAFPAAPITRAGMVEVVGAARVLTASVRGEVIGMALFNREGEPGYLRTLAVREAWRGRGVGGALTVRVARAVFGAGAQTLDLRTEEDNAGAIRLYTRLGFKHRASGRDYERPADPKVIERMRREGEGTFIKFGGWR